MQPREAFQGTTRFEIVRQLGQGGMGVVYEALDRERGSRVALKMLLNLHAEGLVQFKREFRALQGMQHPSLVGLRELIEHDGQWFFTMDLIRGFDIYRHFHRAMPSPDVVNVDPELQIVPAATQAPGTMSTGLTSGMSGPPAIGRTLAKPLAPAQVDELRRATAQVVSGLMALHRAHKIHRDVKPSNILVDIDAGTAKLVDFGIVADVREVTGAQGVNGTIAFMAPEQAAGRALTFAVDWYGLGASLYRILTGQLPFSGSLADVLDAKMRSEHVPITSWGLEIPADLAALCNQLLARAPEDRPTGEQIRARLGFAEGSNVQLGDETLFVGRTAELAVLETAYRQASTRPQVVFVEGVSGLGKSALVREFSSSLARLEPRPLVLSGRCYERESVPYKAVDAIVDALSAHLAGMHADEREALLPDDAPLLGQVFPTLQRLPAFQASGASPATVDPHEQRGRVFAALRTLLRRLSERSTLVLAIDDLQWADADSLALLADLVGGEHAPRLLLVASLRTGLERHRGVLSFAHVVERLACPITRLELRPMSAADAQTLARELLLRAPRTSHAPVDVAALASAAEGHPLFIETLLRHQMSGVTEAVQLDDALWAIVLGLDERPRRTLEIIAVAGAPVAQVTLAQAAGLSLQEFDEVVTTLRVSRLIHTSGARRSHTVETYHDRVRETVVAHLDEPARQAIHRRLANAVETAYVPDDARLARHWSEAGEPGRAVKYAVLAAERAEEALAFDRAAEWFAFALELQASAGEDTNEQRIRLAGALSHAGRGTEAAKHYLEAAAQVNVQRALELRVAAATQYLRSGHFDEGIAVVRDVLPMVGETYPKTPGRALLSVIGNMVRLRARGLKFTLTPEREVDPRDLLRIDALGSVCTVLSMVDPIRGRCLAQRQILRALSAGEIHRLALSLAAHVTHAAATGGARSDRQVAALLAAIAPLAERTEKPLVLGRIAFARGSVAYLRGRWCEALAALREAIDLFSSVPGAAFEVHASESWLFNALASMGELSEIARLLPAKLRAAEERGDLYASTLYRASYASVVWLAKDQPERLLADLDVAARQWSPNGFHLQHWYELHGRLQALLYTGDLAAARALLEARGPALQKSMLMRLESVRCSWAVLKARVLLLAAASEPERRAQHLAAATECTGALVETTIAWAEPWRHLLHAGVAHLQEDDTRARELYGKAGEGFEGADMRTLAAAAHWLLGGLKKRRGEDPGPLLEEARVYFEIQGVAAPERFVTMFLPVASAHERA